MQKEDYLSDKGSGTESIIGIIWKKQEFEQ